MKTVVYNENLEAISVDGTKTDVGGSFRTAIEKWNNRLLSAIAKITYTQLVELDPSIIITTSSDAYHSYKLQVSNGRLSMGKKWLSADGSCIADGSYFACPGTVKESYRGDFGWWANEASQPDKTFLTDQVISIEFTIRGIKFLDIVFDNKREEWAENFTVNFYKDGSIEFTLIETDNDTFNYSKDVSAENLTGIYKIELIITKWSHPGRQAKVCEFSSIYYEIYRGDEIFNISVLQETDFEGQTIPVGNISANSVTLKLDNSTKKFSYDNTESLLYNQLRPNNKIEIYLGVITAIGDEEYVKMGTYFANKWNVPEGEIYAEVEGKDLISLIEKRDYRNNNILNDTNLKEIIEDILLSASIHADSYDISPEMEEFEVQKAYISNMNARKALVMAVSAGLGRAYVDDNSVLKIIGLSSVVGVTVAVTNEARVSYYHQLINSRAGTGKKWLSADGSCIADGSYFACPGDLGEAIKQEFGYWDNELSDVSGNFPAAKIIKLTLTPVRDIDYIRVAFDDKRNEYAKDFIINFRDLDNGIIHSIIISSNTQAIYEEDLSAVEINNTKYIELIINNWNEPLRQVKVTEFFFENYLTAKKIITEDEYFSFDNPKNVKELINHISVETMPLRTQNITANTKQIVYEDTENKIISAGSTQIITVTFNTKPVENPETILQIVTGSGSIISITPYSWGADVEIESGIGEDLYYRLKIIGDPLIIAGRETYITENGDSIGIYGKKEFSFGDNQLVQTKAQAEIIGYKLLSSFEDVRKDTKMQWVGNPALELADIITAVNKFKMKDNFIIRQEFEFDGGLECNISCKEV